MILVYGNCQAKALYSVLNQSKNFTKKFGIDKTILNNYESIRERSAVKYSLFRKCCLFIYQPLSDKHKQYSTNHLLNYVPKDCVKLAIPYIYNDAFFKSCKSLDYIIGEFDLSAHEDLNERFEYCCSIQKTKDKDCNVKLFEFIKNHKSPKNLYITQNHPSKELIIEVVKQCFDYFNIYNDLIDFNFDPIYQND